MGRIFGILFICLGIWVGVEIYFEGTQGAFGGVFASAPAEGDAAPDRRSTPQRAGDAASRAHAQNMERIERELSD